jgi:hypothetical protein
VTKEEGKEKVKGLIELFKGSYAEKTASEKRAYNEATVREKFLNPFFDALGWAMASNDVEVEYSQVREDDGSKGKADYRFNLGAGKEFYVEAKKPSENLAAQCKHSIQARRYAYSANHTVTILTDFEEFQVYLGRGKAPKDEDQINTAMVSSLSCQYTDYLDRWDDIWRYFSRESVLAGSLENVPGVKKGAKGDVTVDALFLADIEKWRQALAENIYINNADLTPRLLNELVQKTIDRIIFLRICEDRDIESYGRILKLKSKPNIYKGLLALFRQADERYNSGLFHFKKESDREDFDDISCKIIIEDEPLIKIIDRLYWPGGPYAFAVMPADILGQVYERFLGKVIEIGERGLTVEEKPEVKKAGGVFYTPEYIVDYIVKNTVGRLLEGKKPDTAAKIKILDPACGSGAFLINAYQCLLDWHLDWHKANNPEKYTGKNKPLIKDDHDNYRLSLAERKKILLNNIHGVDIDSQAVEVARLSLLLKCLEGQNRHSLQTELFHERLLPDLDGNVKCGNSLIGRDIYESEQGKLFERDREEKLRINAFDWKTEFKPIMDQGGFDAVIGNPPYVRQESLGAYKAYFQSHFNVYHGIADLYAYFIEQGVSLLREKGLFGYIVANKWMRANYGEPLRRWLKSQDILEIIDFGDLPVFKTATTYPCILVISKMNIGVPPPGTKVSPHKATAAINITQVKTLAFDSLEHYVQENRYALGQETLDNGGWSLADGGTQKLLDKLKAKGTPLGDYVKGNIYRGVLTGLNEAFVIDEETKDRLIAQDPKSAELIKPFLAGRDIKRYAALQAQKYLITIPKGWTRAQSSNSENAWAWFERNYPSIAHHLKPFEIKGQKRYDKGEYWWELRTCDYYDEFEKPKIFWPEIASSARFAFDVASLYANNKVFMIPGGSYYLLGLLNSSLLKLFIHSVCTDLQGNSFNFSAVFVAKTPIRDIQFNNPIDKKKHDDIVKLVENILAFHKELKKSGLDSIQKRSIEQDIADTDRKIDALVYELYDLTPEERAILEGAA